MSSAMIRSETVCQTAFEINVSPGRAASARREARFTDWPVSAKVCPGPLLRLADHLAGGDADVSLELPSGRLAYRRQGDVVDRERGADRPLAVVAMRHGRAEDRHDAVAGVLVHRAPVGLDLTVDGPEEAEHQLVQLFRVELAR